MAQGMGSFRMVGGEGLELPPIDWLTDGGGKKKVPHDPHPAESRRAGWD